MYKIVHIFVYHSIKVPVPVQFCTDFGVTFGAHAHVLQKCHSATPQMQQLSSLLGLAALQEGRQPGSSFQAQGEAPTDCTGSHSE